MKSFILPALVVAVVVVAASVPALAQPPQCDPTKVQGSETCIKCHASEVATWQQTPHYQTFEQLHRNPRAKEIAQLMGQRSIKRGDLCIDCHYTSKAVDEKISVISGVSCESCHGAAADWLEMHNDYGGPTATRESESETHRQQRIENSIAAGMRNPSNLYLLAQSCLNCHTVPKESLVNEGTHHAGSAEFELVAWSQGRVRHNFVRSNGERNDPSPPERLRVMYVTGQIADLEYSTRATAQATYKAKYGLVAAQRAAAVAVRLFEIQQEIKDPVLAEILTVFAEARLAANNRDQLESIADRIRQLGIQFASEADGKNLAAIDRWLPDPASYR